MTPHLNSAKSRVNLVKLSWLSQPQKKKKYFSKFSSIFQTPNFQFKNFNPKFSIPHYQCPNFKLKSSVFKKKFKPQISWSKLQALIFKILSFKISDFNFQISSQNLQVPKSQNLKWKFQNFQVSKIKCFSKKKSFVN